MGKGERKVKTSYGTYYYEKIPKIQCPQCGRIINESQGYFTKCRFCGNLISTPF
ncbi:uncharacterized protein METZ01_LOCUS436417 [marine metagenome]|uniref:Uncharacterized protein n=1 Tax=marine metagenome TaxID=408172 RepID=A0A382YJX0_9ZZZZ